MMMESFQAAATALRRGDRPEKRSPGARIPLALLERHGQAMRKAAGAARSEKPALLAPDGSRAAHVPLDGHCVARRRAAGPVKDAQLREEIRKQVSEAAKASGMGFSSFESYAWSHGPGAAATKVRKAIGDELRKLGTFREVGAEGSAEGAPPFS